MIMRNTLTAVTLILILSGCSNQYSETLEQSVQRLSIESVTCSQKVSDLDKALKFSEMALEQEKSKVLELTKNLEEIVGACMELKNRCEELNNAVQIFNKSFRK